MSTDRNQQARSDFEFRRATKQFQDALAAGQAAVRDRFGNGLAEGDTVLFEPAMSLMATVTKIVPVFDPGVQVGTMRLEITAMIPVQIPANVPLERIVRISQRTQTAQTEPPADPPPGPGDEPPPVMPPADAPTDLDAVPLVDGPHDPEDFRG